MLMSNKIRITIALIALGYKPIEQSFESYVQVLLENFPTGSANKGDRERQTQWEDKALALEKRLHDLQQSFDNEHAELLLLRVAAISQVTEPLEASTSSATVTAGGPKKKKKKLNAQDPPQPRSHGSSQALRLPSLCGSDSLLSRLYLLDDITSRQDDISEDEVQTLLVVTERSLAMLTTTLTSMLLPDRDSERHKPQLIDDLATLLDRILTIIPRLHFAVGSKLKGTRKKAARAQSSDRLDSLFGQLSMTLLVPLVRSFSVLSRAQIAAALGPTSSPLKERKNNSWQKQDTTSDDLRTHVLAFFQKATDSLQNIAASLFSPTSAHLAFSIQGMFDNLLLAACSEMERLYGVLSGDDTSVSSDGHESHNPSSSNYSSRTTSLLSQIESRLSRKDALWYLCSLMHLLIPASAALSAQLPSHHTTEPPSHNTNLEGNQDANVDELRVDEPRANSSEPSYLCQAMHHKTMAEAICASLARLLRPTPTDGSGGQKRIYRFHGGLQETERSMVLAVAEKVWLTFR
ncbi:hypothetical protein BC629DRAFT_1481102 [Irpex lacteus]|nr:hypothetical protein BC629DRAFT_1481102 [Irpex lacteus]